MKTKVILLGTGTPIPDPEHFGPYIAVKRTPQSKNLKNLVIQLTYHSWF